MFNEIALKGDLGIVEYFHMHIDKAVARCRGQVDVGVNLPWAYFDLGFFELLRRQPIPAVHYYARGIDQATHMWMVRSARKPTATLRPTGMDLPGLDIIDTLLYLGAWIKAGRSEQSDVSNDPVWSIPVEADAPLFGDDVRGSGSWSSGA